MPVILSRIGPAGNVVDLGVPAISLAQGFRRAMGTVLGLGPVAHADQPAWLMRTLSVVGLAMCLANCATATTQPSTSATPMPTTERTQVALGGTNCDANLIHTGKAADGNGVPWLKEVGTNGELIGHFFYQSRNQSLSYALLPVGGQDSAGTAAKVLWVFWGKAKITGEMELLGTIRNGSSRMRATFPNGGGSTFPSIVNLPAAGCWDLAVKSGEATFSVTIVASNI